MALISMHLKKRTKLLDKTTFRVYHAYVSHFPLAILLLPGSRGSKAYLKEKWTYGARMKIVFSWNFLLYAFIPIFRTSCFLKKSICPFSLTVRQVVMGGRRRCHYKVRRVAFQKGKVKSTRCTPQATTYTTAHRMVCPPLCTLGHMFFLNSLLK